MSALSSTSSASKTSANTLLLLTGFLKSAKALVDKCDNQKSAIKAGESLASVVYNIEDPSEVNDYTLKYLNGANKIKWFAAIQVAAAILAAADTKILKDCAELYTQTQKDKKNPSDTTTTTYAHLVIARRRAAIPVFAPLISRLIEIRTEFECPAPHLKADAAVFNPYLNMALGCALRAFGPENVLKLGPMDILNVPLEDENFSREARSWWLVLIREHVRRADCSFFASQIVPLASALFTKMVAAHKANKTVHVAKYNTLFMQCWNCLPALLACPLNLEAAFADPALPSALIAAISDNKLNPIICRALRLCAAFAKQCANALNTINEAAAHQQQEGDEWSEEDDEKNTVEPTNTTPGALSMYFPGDMMEYHTQLTLTEMMADFGFKDRDLPCEKHAVAYVARYTGESTMRALKLTAELLPTIIEQYSALHKDCVCSKTLKLTGLKQSNAALILETIANLAPLLEQAHVDERLTVAFNRIIALVTDKSTEPLFPLELPCLVDLADSLVLHASPHLMNQALQVLLPIAALPVADDNNAVFSESRRALQRRCYKMLRNILSKVAKEGLWQHANATKLSNNGLEFLSEIWIGLSKAEKACHFSARHNRLLTIKHFIELAAQLQELHPDALVEFKKQLIPEVVKQILLRALDAAKDVRKTSLALLFETCTFMGKNMMMDIIAALLSGLGLPSAESRAAALTCLARFLVAFSRDLDREYLHKFCHVILVNLKATEPIVLRAAIRFSLAVVKVLEVDELREFVEKDFRHLFSNPSTRQHTRLRARRLVDRLLTKMGMEELEKVFPEEYVKLLQYVARAQRRKARKAAIGGKRAVIAGEIESDDEFDPEDGEEEVRRYGDDDAMGLESHLGDSRASDLESINEDEEIFDKLNRSNGLRIHQVDASMMEEEDDGAVARHRGRSEVRIRDELVDSDEEDAFITGRNRGKMTLRGLREQNQQLMVDGDGFDLADETQLASRIALVGRNRRRRNDDDAGGSNYYDDKTGKLVVLAGDDVDGVVRKKVTAADRLQEEYRKKLADIKKAKEDRNLESIALANQSLKAQRHRENMLRRKQGHFEVHSSEQYASRKAGGDVMRGDTAPASYVKFNPSLVSETKRHQSMRSFENMFKAAKRGAVKGKAQRRAASRSVGVTKRSRKAE